jgi:hypothetical protein
MQVTLSFGGLGMYMYKTKADTMARSTSKTHNRCLFRNSTIAFNPSVIAPHIVIAFLPSIFILLNQRDLSGRKTGVLCHQASGTFFTLINEHTASFPAS